MARFTTLYSGSSGNCAVVQSGQQYLLVDMGKSCRITLNALAELGLSVRDCAGVLITHEHSDHIKGLQVFLRHYSLPVYGGAATLDALEQMDILPPRLEAIALENRSEELAGYGVSAFPTSHDVPCCGYRIETPDGRCLTIATDLGTITPVVHANLQGADLVALEANYDLARLRLGPYPYYLKKRIESTHGHLANDVCATQICELVQAGCERFALCHLSQENNTPELALASVHGALAMAGIVPSRDTLVRAQRRGEVTPWMEF